MTTSYVRLDPKSEESRELAERVPYWTGPFNQGRCRSTPLGSTANCTAELGHTGVHVCHGSDVATVVRYWVHDD